MVRFRKTEGVTQKLEARLGVFRLHYFDDVESKKNIGIIQHAQPGERAARNAMLLIARNGFEGTTEIFARTRFHFDKNERVVVAADDVDFAATASAEIAVENFETIAAQKTAREFFAKSAALQMFGSRERKIAPPNCGDETSERCFQCRLILDRINRILQD